MDYYLLDLNPNRTHVMSPRDVSIADRILKERLTASHPSGDSNQDLSQQPGSTSLFRRLNPSAEAGALNPSAKQAQSQILVLVFMLSVVTFLCSYPHVCFSSTLVQTLILKIQIYVQK